MSRFNGIFDWTKGLGTRIAAAIAQRQYSSGYGFTNIAVSNLRTLTFEEATKKGYKGLTWVHRCIAARGQAIGSVPWKAYSVNTKDNTHKHLPGHPLETLLEKPNPYCTRQELFSSWSIFLSLSGKAFWEVVYVDNGKTPYQLFSLRPDWMVPDPDEVTYVKGWTLDPKMPDVTPAKFKPEEVMFFRYVDPLDEYGGLSPLQAAYRTIQTEDAAIGWNKSIFDNSAVPGGWLEMPAQNVRKDQRIAMREELEREFTRDNLHRPMVLWGGMKWNKMAIDAKDLDFLNMRNLNKFEICAILETPPGIVGANEDPTYANYDVARTAWWEDSIIPMLEWLQGKINTQLAPGFGKNIIAKYDISDVPAMRRSYSEKVKTAKDLWTMGYPVNAINRRMDLGLPNLLWGDAAWLQINMMPLSTETWDSINKPPELNPANPVNDNNVSQEKPPKGL